MTTAAPPGLDLNRLTAFLEAERPHLLTGPLRARLLVGGRSNLTYEIDDGARQWVLRRPPLGHVLATAHDMAREYRVLRALGGTAVPVPEVHLLCTDADVLGAPFYLMQKVDGATLRTRADMSSLGPEQTRAVSSAMIDCLADLHAVLPARVGLADLGRPSGFLDRQVRRWKAQLDASHSRELPGADELHRLLIQRVPPESGVSIVHGDYRLDNLLIDADGRVNAVLDWEMATLGDPLTDLALLTAYRDLADLAGIELGIAACAAPGFLDVEDMLERYALRRSRPLPALAFHRGLAFFKLAAILEGIHYRFTRGQTVGPGFDRIAAVVPPLIEAGLTACKEIH